MSLTVDAKRAPTPPAVQPGVPVPAVAAPSVSVFHPDTPTGPDQLGRAADAAFLAELVTHKQAGTPFCIGVFGPAGSGKSAFLAATASATERLTTAAEAAGIATPFLGNVAVLRVTAQSGVSPAASVLQQAAAALAATFPKLAAAASHAGRDPRRAARDASDRLNEARQRLDAERRTLDDLSGRQARLVEGVLFDSAGSRVDAYARSNRARIDRSLRRFGIPGDSSATGFKELVREEYEAGGGLTQKAGWLRAFWRFRGQTRLIVVAVAFFAVAWGVGSLMANADTLIEDVRSANEKLGSTADWIATHQGWLEPLKQVLEIAGLVALATNVVRGIRFLQPVVRGASLLRADVETRRRDLDSLLAHQHRRVDTLTGEADLAGRHAADAEDLLASSTLSGLPLPTAGSDEASGAGRDVAAARTFVASLETAMRTAAKDRVATSQSAAPTRIVVGLDGLDQLPASEAAAFLTLARDLFDRPGFVTLVAADRLHLVDGLAPTDPALAARQVARLVQVPYTIAGESDAWAGARPFVQALLRGAAAEKAVVPDAPDATHSALDMPWLQSEMTVLEALVPFAGTTPRAVKRFVNLYRVARADPRMRGGTAPDLATLALGLAAQPLPTPMPGLDDPFEMARTVAAKALGTTLDPKPTDRGMATARLYSGL